MEFRTHSFRYGLEIFTTQQDFRVLWNEVIDSINSISDEDIIQYFENQERRAKSISEAINNLLDERLTARGWHRQSFIFNDPTYRSNRGNSNWRLDFAKNDISIESIEENKELFYDELETLLNANSQNFYELLK